MTLGITDATGALGRPVARALSERGREPTGLAAYLSTKEHR